MTHKPRFPAHAAHTRIPAAMSVSAAIPAVEASAAPRDDVDPSRWQYGVSLDTETSGTYTRCRVVQVAALRFRFRMPLDAETPEIEFSERYRLVSLVKPPSGTPFIPEAVAITGIGWAQVRSAPAFHEIEDRLLEIIASLDVVAYNAPFDRRFVAKEFQERPNGNPILDSQWKCSLAMARQCFPKAPSHKLGPLTGVLGIRPSGGLHHAGTDAELSGRLYAHMRLRPPGRTPDLMVSETFPSPGR